jgi:poly(3-hydroxybutyrate) depolymerase
MLYDLHELQRSFLNPLAAFADTGSRLFSHPYSPFAYLPLSRQIAASYELVHRIDKDYEKPAWNIDATEIHGERVPVRDRIAVEKPFCNLVHFERQRPESVSADPTVLLVAPLSGHHATLLRDTVRGLLPAHNIYVTDWVDARMVAASKGPFGLDDYVQYIQDFLQWLGPDTHVISVCQPTVPVLAAISLMASNHHPCMPRSMVMMGGPIDPRKSPTQVNRLATTRSYSWFENNVIHRVPARYPGAGRPVYPGFLQHAGFMAMNPDRHLRSHYDFYLHLISGDDDDAQTHRRFYDEYNAVLDMPAEFYLDTIKIIFQEYRLPLGTWEIAGQKVDPGAISNVSLLTIEGELDDISGQGQTRAAQSLCRSIDKAHKQHYTAHKCGHFGIFSGRRWRETICPKITEFIRQSA